MTPPYEANQVMLDLETLDTAPTAIVLSIGLVRFDPADHDDPVKDRHTVVLSMGDQEEMGRTTSDATLSWWKAQSTAAQAVLAQSATAAHDVHEQLIVVAQWLGKDAVIWGNGSDFDNVILARLYRNYDLKLPWSHRNNRCFRTLCAMGERRITPAWQAKLGLTPLREGTHHNALDDAVYQARIAARYLRVL